ARERAGVGGVDRGGGLRDRREPDRPAAGGRGVAPPDGGGRRARLAGRWAVAPVRGRRSVPPGGWHHGRGPCGRGGRPAARHPAAGWLAACVDDPAPRDAEGWEDRRRLPHEEHLPSAEEREARRAHYQAAIAAIFPGGG